MKNVLNCSASVGIFGECGCIGLVSSDVCCGGVVVVIVDFFAFFFFFLCFLIFSGNGLGLYYLNCPVLLHFAD